MKQQVVLIGLPGAGKTTVGRLVAERLHTQFADTDEIFAATHGVSAGQYIERFGEARFRQEESVCTLEALRQSGVVALGGGSVLAPGVAELLAHREVVHLDGADSDLASRLSQDSQRRPLLQPNGPEENVACIETEVQRLRRERASYYEAVRSHHVDTTGLAPSTVAQIVSTLITEKSPAIPLYLPNIQQMSAALASFLAAKRCTKVFFIATEDLRDLVGALSAPLRTCGRTYACHFHRAGEDAKTIRTAAQIWGELEDFGLGRDDFIVSVGGGVTSDLAGFVASTWFRGVGLIHCPTTTLGMVDAALGGKTGIDGVRGKNQIGTFYLADLVLSSLEVLQTLPERDYRSGLVEALKCSAIADRSLLEEFVSTAALGSSHWALHQGKSLLEKVIVSADRIKIDHVGTDLYDRGKREFLNFGHTVAHAIESASAYQIIHGEAVALGMRFAVQVSVSRASFPAADRDLLCRGIDVLEPTDISMPPWDEIAALLRHDKKRRAGEHRMVLLREIARPVVEVVPDEALERAARELGWK